MREIKFRAWLKEEKILITVYVLDQTVKASTGKHYPTSRGFTDEGGTISFNLDDVELMQYIWLKDKDDVEIYVGDVYEWDYEYDSDYDGDMPIVKRSTGVDYVRDIFDRTRINMAASEGSKVKVIGNIHANPNW